MRLLLDTRASQGAWSSIENTGNPTFGKAPLSNQIEPAEVEKDTTLPANRVVVLHVMLVLVH